MTPYLLQAKEAGCQAILMGGNVQDLPSIAQQMATQNMQDVVMLPTGGYEPPPTPVQPGWRNLFGLFDALALLWPLAALIATAVEWRMLRPDPRARTTKRPL